MSRLREEVTAMPSALRTLEQERAKHAWDCVQEVKDKPFAGDYRAIAVKVPSLIVTNGLGQTLAFLTAQRQGLSRATNMIRCSIVTLPTGLARKVHADGDLLSWLVNTATSQQYRLATMEALALLQWLKRFAEAELPKGREE
jgi:CRISPR-associated protein Cmr5